MERTIRLLVGFVVAFMMLFIPEDVDFLQNHVMDLEPLNRFLVRAIKFIGFLSVILLGILNLWNAFAKNKV